MIDFDCAIFFLIPHVEGKEALSVNHAFFNKKASASYKELPGSEKKLLEQEGRPSEVQYIGECKNEEGCYIGML